MLSLMDTEESRYLIVTQTIGETTIGAVPYV